MAKLSDLKIENENLGGAGTFEDLPEQLGGFKDPPQPGPYRVRFPSAGVLGEAWGKLEKTEKRGERIVAILQNDAAFTIVQSPGGTLNGDVLETRISNAERKRGKGEQLASDMDYALLVTEYKGPKPAFGDNAGYAQAFLSVAGKEIGIDWELSWFCNPNKPARMDDGNNGVVVCDGKDGRPDQKGCGERYYLKDVQKSPDEKGNMVYPTEMECGACKAVLRAYGQIARFRK